MTIIDYRRPPIALATLALLLTGAVGADRVQAQGPVPLTLNANVQLTKLHPSVTHVGMMCLAQIPSPLPATPGLPPTTLLGAKSNPMPVVNRGYAGIVTATTNVNQEILANPANRTMNVTCKLSLYRGNGSRDAVATAAEPQPMETALTGNWNVVATGSVVTWTQAVTFANASPTP